MRPFIPLALTALALLGYSMGDETPLLNAWELLRASGLSLLPESGTRYIAYQEKLGQAALPAAWALWILASVLLSYSITKVWQMLR